MLTFRWLFRPSLHIVSTELKSDEMSIHDRNFNGITPVDEGIATRSIVRACSSEENTGVKIDG